MSYNLFLDDERVPEDCAAYMYRFGIDCRIYDLEWVVVRSYKQFCDIITERGLPERIAFDHDLADVPELKESLAPEEYFSFDLGREYTGMDCAHWLVKYCMDNNLPLPEFTVHSMNVVGRENIRSLLNNYNSVVERPVSQKPNLWWGYKHISGTYQAKRYYEERDISEALESDFVQDVWGPFEATDRDQALVHIRENI